MRGETRSGSEERGGGESEQVHLGEGSGSVGETKKRKRKEEKKKQRISGNAVRFIFSPSLLLCSSILRRKCWPYLWQRHAEVKVD